MSFRRRHGARVKFALLIVLVSAAAALVHFTELMPTLAYEDVQTSLNELGFWAPIGFILLYATLIVLTVPGTVVTVTGAMIFPLGEAFLLTIAGAMLGASVSFAVARTLGREAVAEFFEEVGPQGLFAKIRDWTERAERNGLLAVAYLRMAYVPFSALNYIAPLTGVSFRDFTLGTLIGILPGAFVFVFMGNTVRSAWETGSLAGVEPTQAFIAAALFIASLFLPVLVQRRIGGTNKRE